MRTITSAKGHKILLDDADFEIWGVYRWKVLESKCGRYHQIIRRSKHKGKATQWTLARKIMDCPKGLVVDHINHDQLDNRRENLRICTPAENARNMRRPQHREFKSPYKGLTWQRKLKRGKYEYTWRATVVFNGKDYYAGSSVNPEKAARKYDTMALKLFGEFAHLNFPELREIL